MGHNCTRPQCRRSICSRRSLELKETETNETQFDERSAQVSIPGFEIISLLGQGGHGIVYKAICKPLNRTVALKIMVDEGAPDRNKNFERIQNEAKILARLSHPNIVQVFQVGFTADGKAYLVSEFLEGTTLDTLLSERGRLNDNEIKSIIHQVSEALSFLHENGLVHRDIKPSNIMLSADSGSKYFQVKLLDFGVTREFIEEGAGPNAARTATLAMLGTPAYMSPEQCKGTKLDARSDLYSLACVCFQCVYGEIPFTGESAFSVQYKHINEDVGNLDPIKANPSDSLSQFFRRAMAKEPDARPKNSRQFKEEFFDALKKTQVKGAEAGNAKRFSVITAITALLLASGFGAMTYIRYLKEKSAPDLVISQKVKASASNSPRALPESELASLVEKYKPRIHNLYSKTELLQSRRELLKRIDAVLPKVKNNKSLDFLANYLKARIFSELKAPVEEQRKLLLRALADCRIDKDSEYYQAVHCYILLAALENEGNPSLALEYARKAEKIVQAQKNNEPIFSMELPSSLKNALDPVWQQLPNLIAEIEEKRGNYIAALKYFKEGSLYGMQEYGTSGGVVGQRGIADVLVKQGKVEQARSLLLGLIRKIDSERPETTGGDLRQARALTIIGQWFYERGEKDIALQCLAIVHKKQKTHKLINPAASRVYEESYEELKNKGRLELWDDGTNILSSH